MENMVKPGRAKFLWRPERLNSEPANFVSRLLRRMGSDVFAWDGNRPVQQTESVGAKSATIVSPSASRAGAATPAEHPRPLYEGPRVLPPWSSGLAAPSLLVLLLLALPSRGHVIADIPERGELTRSTQTMRGKLSCRAPAGTPVRILGRPGGPGASLHPLRLAIRVLAEPCLDFEATAPDTALRNVVPIEPAARAAATETPARALRPK